MTLLPKYVRSFLDFVRLGTQNVFGNWKKKIPIGDVCILKRFAEICMVPGDLPEESAMHQYNRRYRCGLDSRGNDMKPQKNNNIRVIQANLQHSKGALAVLSKLTGEFGIVLMQEPWF